MRALSTLVNRQIVLASRPNEIPSESDFRTVESPVPSPSEGEVLVRAIWLSLDPYMRGRIRDAPSYAPPVQIGHVMVGGVVGEIMESRTPAFQV
ncbi:MAG: NADP-dependent oxidoreductase, partial [Chloroflexi bacterium]|nr:NADP-dependent oxidoreductase [Chloroflexota bacterium]